MKRVMVMVVVAMVMASCATIDRTADPMAGLTTDRAYVPDVRKSVTEFRDDTGQPVAYFIVYMDVNAEDQQKIVGTALFDKYVNLLSSTIRPGYQYRPGPVKEQAEEVD
ncbi:hypothetical protein LCGC14_0384430 [marine sediment metagenome]|uniref:Uncharacterized protein n=1 Tax=marine sediment metagenome TaxID=412755 RepID=A0A0F9T796_9ZZZZ